MKRQNSHKNGNGHVQSIRIEFTDPVAASVAIAGSFNEWRPGASPMLAVDHGRWIKDLALPPGTYEYRLVVDGVWIPDPAVRETVANPFGERNSVLKVNPAAMEQQSAANPKKESKL